MYICLVIAILASFKWLDTILVEFINAKVNPYQKNEEDAQKDKINAMVRTACIIIAALFWAAVALFWN